VIKEMWVEPRDALPTSSLMLSASSCSLWDSVKDMLSVRARPRPWGSPAGAIASRPPGRGDQRTCTQMEVRHPTWDAEMYRTIPPGRRTGRRPVAGFDCTCLRGEQQLQAAAALGSFARSLCISRLPSPKSMLVG